MRIQDIHGGVTGPVFAAFLLTLSLTLQAESQSDKKKEDSKKKSEPFKVQKLTQGMGLYSLGPVSNDGRHILLLAKKPDRAPNLYIMDIQDFSIRPPLTDFQWGVTGPAWSPDGAMVAFAGFNETATFSEVYTLELKTGKTRRLTSNSFSDKEPVFSPDGKRILYATDESPLPDAAFGILHVATLPLAGGKHEGFTEDEGSSTLPGFTPDGASVLLVKIDESSGRHSLWQYGSDGKPVRDLTGRKLARIHRYITSRSGGFIALWGQEEPEQQDNIYVLDLKSGEMKPLPDDDLPKRSPSISPDGRRIAFLAPFDNSLQVFVCDLSTGQNHQLTARGVFNHSPAFISNDRILFGSDRDKDNEIYLLDMAAPAEEEKKKK
jgi:Tol biopolymer transport system component